MQRRHVRPPLQAAPVARGGGGSLFHHKREDKDPGRARHELASGLTWPEWKSGAEWKPLRDEMMKAAGTREDAALDEP
jgi:hypothetical protein